jgi:hypothetical protein
LMHKGVGLVEVKPDPVIQVMSVIVASPVIKEMHSSTVHGGNRRALCWLTS